MRPDLTSRANQYLDGEISFGEFVVAVVDLMTDTERAAFVAKAIIHEDERLKDAASATEPYRD